MKALAVFALLLSGCAVGVAPSAPLEEDAGAPDARADVAPAFQGEWFPDAAPATWSDDAGWVTVTTKGETR